jgi:hypothetical protein
MIRSGISRLKQILNLLGRLPKCGDHRLKSRDEVGFFLARNA